MLKRLGQKNRLSAPLEVRSVSVVLPYPPSANRYWRSYVVNGSVRVVVSKEGKDYKRAAYRLAALSIKNPLDGPLFADYKVYRPRKAGDLSNRIKVVEDALEGVAYDNDNQIVEMHAKRFDDKENPRIEITIRKL